MRYSKLFGKTVKTTPRDAATISHQLLYQAGFIRESAAGRYFFLPLGHQVQKKIMRVIKQEMDAVGAQEMIVPVLHPLSLWQETNRDKETGFELSIVTDQRGMQFALGGTAEEMFVDVVRKFQLSYKDLPFNIYQFSSKFRDELRARGGLLRVREFIMKDAYSFDIDDQEFKKSYQTMWDTYSKIFSRLGLKTIVVEADNGYIGGEYCHEFVVESEIGESKFLTTEDGSYTAHEDVAKFFREPINKDEPLKDLQIIDQPQWVKTMDDNVKHYQLPKSRFLKNVVYKNRITNELIIAVTRGDLEVNKNKLEHVVNAVGQLEDAANQDITDRLKVSPGYVHSWGHDHARFIGDLSLETVHNFIGGQKTDTTDACHVNYSRDFKCEILADIALVKAGDLTEDKHQPLIAKRGIEVGNIFQLGYHYSKKMANSTFIDKNGHPQPYYMGCYGIGIGRTLATIVEKFHDDHGIIWPEIVAPYQVHLIGLNLNQVKTKQQAEKVYQTLLKSNIDVLYDDREQVSAGEKFADCDLIGIPWRIVVSEKTKDQIEIKRRTESESHLTALSKFLTDLQK